MQASAAGVTRSSPNVASRSVDSTLRWHDMMAGSQPAACPATAFTRSSAWGFFFCGMMLLVPARPSSTCTNENSHECQT